MTGDMRTFYENEAERRKWGEALAGEGLFPTELQLVREAFVPGGRVLDVGCGGGREAFGLAALGFQVTAVDYLPAFVAACRQGAAARGLSLDVRQADAAELPFADGAFDHVMMVGQLLGHVRPRERRRQVLREIGRVMRPGTAIVSTNAIERRRWYGAYFWLLNGWRRVYNPLGLEPDDAFVRRIGGEKSASGERPLFHWYRTPEFRRDAAAAGWRVERWLRRYEQERALADPSTSGETFYVLRKE
ncbi:MAG: class I SAM-dependent methyltransferase [Myxococcales bacterium]|nr:class I SAM-dependent methyltransferase [Myxococcales bacterium]